MIAFKQITQFFSKFLEFLNSLAQWFRVNIAIFIVFAVDMVGPGVNNDFAVFRLADVILMKAEALVRTSNATGALTLVNAIRQKRGVADLAALTLDNLLDERGRELYWEGYRRQDLIRFGKFLNAYQEKPAADAHTLIFPIPSSQLAVNANLTQNPGY